MVAAMAVIAGRFKIICDRCGALYDAVPSSDFGVVDWLKPNTMTVATVEHCSRCVMEARPVSHRTLFLCKVVKELEDLKRGK
jgi:hypothetical protein